MSFESVLRAVFAGGNVKDTIYRVRCGTGFSMRSVLVTRKSLWWLYMHVQRTLIVMLEELT